jgi:hypothetical protein
LLSRECYTRNRATALYSSLGLDLRVLDKKIGPVDLAFDLKSDTRNHRLPREKQDPVDSCTDTPPSLPTNELVAKLYWPEEEREGEPEILQKVYEIAKKDEEG